MAYVALCRLRCSWSHKPLPLAAAADFFDRLAAAADKKIGLTCQADFFFSPIRRVKCWLAALTFPADGCKTDDSSYGPVS